MVFVLFDGFFLEFFSLFFYLVFIVGLLERNDRTSVINKLAFILRI